MSAEHTDQIAPRLAQARNATAVCGTFGMNAATRSPGPTPIASSVAANAPTWRRSSGHAISCVRPVGVAEDMPGVVQLRAREPGRARHLRVDQNGRVRRRRDDPEVVPDGLPERPQVVARPAPEAVVALDGGRVEIEP